MAIFSDGYSIGERLQHAWSVFKNPDKNIVPWPQGSSSMIRPDRPRFSGIVEKSIINAIYTRIGIDVAANTFMHARTDENGKYKETIKSSLNERLSLNANKDQTGRAFLQDITMSMLDEGCVAVVPVDTDIDPESGSFKIDSLRVGKILQWFPDYIRVNLYNDTTGNMQEVTVPKKTTVIVENPLYAVMNEPISTLKRLMHKLNLLDAIDDQSGAGKLDLIIQLPYTVKSQSRKNYAEQRRKDIEMQLAGSKYGIAYIDATEHVTQLNRAVENNIMSQIEYLTQQLYGQLGITEAVMNGTASQEEMLNYQSRSIEPICSAIADAFTWKLLTKTARTQGQKVLFVSNPFKLVPAAQMAEIGDKFLRNQILSPNEMRAIIGFKPVDDPRADELKNPNLNDPASGENMLPSVSTDPNADVGELLDTPISDIQMADNGGNKIVHIEPLVIKSQTPVTRSKVHFGQNGS